MAFKNRFQIGKHRFYPCPICGEDHPSVTTLLDVISNPALTGWLSKNSTTKLYHFSKIIEPYVEEKEFQNACKEAEKNWIEKEGTAFWKSGKQTGTEAADIGTISHAAIESHLQGKSVDVRSLPGMSGKSVQGYLDWEKLHKVKVIETEKTFYGCQYNTAGTADFVGEIDGELTIVDFKTSNSIYLNYIFQCWIYALIAESQNGDHLFKQVAIGRFGKDGTHDFKIYKRNIFPGIEEARKIILACGDIFRVQQEWERKFPYVRKEKK